MPRSGKRTAHSRSSTNAGLKMCSVSIGRGEKPTAISSCAVIRRTGSQPCAATKQQFFAWRRRMRSVIGITAAAAVGWLAFAFPTVKAVADGMLRWGGLR